MSRTRSRTLARTAPTAQALAPLAAAAREFVAASRAPATRRAYRQQWRAFVGWAETQGVASLPAAPEAVALYASHLARAGRKVATIEQAIAALTAAHRAAGHANPRDSAAVVSVIAGIRRKLGVAQVQKSPVLAADLRSMVQTLPCSLKGARDRALLLVGFAGAFRRSELVALDVEDLAFGIDGLIVTIRHSKTDQEGAGRKVGVPFGSAPTTCPVRALRAWLEAAGSTTGAVFVGVNRHGRLTRKRLAGGDVARVVKAAAAASGLDSARFAGHSLRAGLATSAAKAGKSERSIMATTGHRSLAMVRRYIREAEIFTDNAAAGLL